MPGEKGGQARCDTPNSRRFQWIGRSQSPFFNRLPAYVDEMLPESATNLQFRHGSPENIPAGSRHHRGLRLPSAQRVCAI